MKNLIDLVNKSFVSSDELNDKMAKINKLKMQFVSILTDKQCIEFLKLYAEMEELKETKVKEYAIQTYKVSKDVYSLR